MPNEYTHKPDGTQRHKGTVLVLRHFRFGHLPPHLAAVSETAAMLAFFMANHLPEDEDLWHGLRDLLRAKDNFVRALVDADEERKEAVGKAYRERKSAEDRVA